MTAQRVLADISAGQFQAAWYYSIVAAALLFLTLYGGGWAIRAAARIYRTDAPAGALLGAAALTAVLIMVGFLIAAAFALHSQFQGG